jgi:hypothetical protein
MEEIVSEMFKNFIISFLLVVSIGTSIACGIFYHRLVKTRQQLDAIRVELKLATNRQSELAEILRRDGEILRESSNTISGIRSQIAVIRESYEAMENILSSDNISSNK